MSRSLRRGALAATALVISIASLTACGAGNDAQTLGVKPDNAAVSVGTIKVQNAVVITQPEAGAKGPAAVSATIFNDGSKDETLEAIELPGAKVTVKLKPATGSGPVTVPAGGSVVIGGKGNASAEIENGHEAAKNGDTQEVVFRLSETGDVKLQALVVRATSYYKDFGPTAAPSQPAGTPTASPTGSPTGSPAATPTGTATAPAAGSEASATPSGPASASHADH
ncbi:DUF461 domain-containing protein [Streptomyces coeruleoprunus]|uniref:DUF461 domain-containing protein n=1 Tax=Streptomyces coeruleoprunus TaxID=285563 RepID=A0ABV9XI91_9ACTN